MIYDEFLEKAIDNGIAAARRDYCEPDQQQKLHGSVAGFEACRDKDPTELKELLETSDIATKDAHQNDHDNYWWYRCYQAEIEWICNVVSSMLISERFPPIVIPTIRGVIQADKILRGEI